jgi:radical SAM superfamily enzyme YgiQ (UPF0313 family)
MLPMPSALLISTYELGHQPFGLASPAAWLRQDGIVTDLVDLARDRLDESVVRRAALVAFHLPMHTATRLAAPVIAKVRALNPAARICAYGLYAPLNREWLQSTGVDDVLGGEFEEELRTIARQVCDPSHRRGREGRTGKSSSTSTSASSAVSERARLPRLEFVVPDRNGLPPLSRYATLRLADGTRRVVGYTEASRGCRHLCRHCPVVPIYEGQFRIVQSDVVLADIDALVAGGAAHITFGDPDFFNGPTHAMRVVDALHERHPALTYDVTIKVEHILKQKQLLADLRRTGCLFITSAVESLDDRVLALLDKGHTRRDFHDVIALTREAGVTLSPTFVAFHPWTTPESYVELLRVIADEDLVEQVAPIQLAIRLLIPQGSRLLEVPAVRQLAGTFDSKTLTYRWSHQDPAVDNLHREIAALVGRRLVSERRTVFAEIADLVERQTGIPKPVLRSGRATVVPHLDEPWYCCAEPNPEQLTLV